MYLKYGIEIAEPGGLKYIVVRTNEVQVVTKDGRKLIYKADEARNEKQNLSYWWRESELRSRALGYSR